MPCIGMSVHMIYKSVLPGISLSLHVTVEIVLPPLAYSTAVFADNLNCKAYHLVLPE